MKKCIVLSGQYRSFDRTSDSIKQLIETNELDVYCHLWSTNQQEIDSITDKLKPKKIVSEDFEVYSNTFASIEDRILKNNPKGPNQDKLSANASMNFGRKAAYSLVPKDVYDIIIYCRYDNLVGGMMFTGLPNVIVTPFEESYNLISDIFAVMPAYMANSYFLYDEYERLHSTQFEPEFEDYLRNVRNYGEENIRIHKYERYCPHMMLLRNIYMNKITNVGTNQLTVHLHR